MIIKGIIIVLLYYISAILCEDCFKDRILFQKWLNRPCGESTPCACGESTPCACGQSNMQHGVIQLDHFIGTLNKRIKKTIESRNYSMEAEYDNTCPNINRLLTRLYNQTNNKQKVKVFYNMLVKISIFIYDVIEKLRNQTTYANRIDLYSDTLCNMKSLVCTFDEITRPHTKTELNKYKMCLEDDSTSAQFLFDLQFMQSMQRFFKESYILIRNIP